MRSEDNGRAEERGNLAMGGGGKGDVGCLISSSH